MKFHDFDVNEILREAKERRPQVVAEFGCSENVRWGNGSLFLADNTPAKCKCGNEATGAIMGKEAYQAFCNECMP